MRVTNQDLDNVIKEINEIAGTPPEPYAADFTPQAGCYHLSGAYGGWQLHQMNEGGSIRAISSGYVSKKEMYRFLYAFKRGLGS